MTDSVFKLFKPELIEYTDSINFIRLKKHISTYGFPGRKKLGGKRLYAYHCVAFVQLQRKDRFFERL
jgi:hypothetical protein